ncbi:MAG: hypothetical protein J6125_04280, partial [Clostridia bacterium]|nr:hypothetical protein [Clostridia bacterium]
EADAIFAKMQAEANGMREMLTKQAEGFKDLIDAAGGTADEAVRIMIADKLEELMKVLVDAIKNIKIDRVTVWDGGQNENGKTATANFLSGMLKSVPPLREVLDQAGKQLPEQLVKRNDEAPAPNAEPKAEPSRQGRVTPRPTPPTPPKAGKTAKSAKSAAPKRRKDPPKNRGGRTPAAQRNKRPVPPGAFHIPARRGAGRRARAVQNDPAQRNKGERPGRRALFLRMRGPGRKHRARRRGIRDLFDQHRRRSRAAGKRRICKDRDRRSAGDRRHRLRQHRPPQRKEQQPSDVHGQDHRRRKARERAENADPHRPQPKRRLRTDHGRFRIGHGGREGERSRLITTRRSVCRPRRKKGQPKLPFLVGVR